MQSKFAFCLRLAHFMDKFDGNIGVLEPVLDKDEAAAWFEGFGHVGDHFVGVIKFVVDINQQHEIAGGWRQFGVCDRSEDRFDGLVDPAFPHVFHEEIEHFLLDIDGEDLAFEANFPGHAPAEEPATGADVSDGVAGLKVEGFQECIRGFFLLPFRAFEPCGALVAHHSGDFAAEKEFAGAVGVMFRAFLVQGGRRGGLGFCEEGGRGEAEEEEECRATHGEGGDS